MYNTTKVAEVIKEAAKNKGVSIAAMLKECGLGKDTINTMARRGSWLQADSLAKIADYLNCSVDYLLGRTDNPQAHKTGSTFFAGDFSGNRGAIGIGNTITSSEPKDAGQFLLLDLFSKLSPKEQAQLLNQVIIKKFKETHTIQQPKENKKITFRIDTPKSTNEKRKEIKEYFEFYECELVEDNKFNMVFRVYYDLDIEGMLAAKGWETITYKKLSD